MVGSLARIAVSTSLRSIACHLLLLALARVALPAPPLKYDSTKYPPLKWGYNDLNSDGVPDALITTWNAKTIAFVSDDGRLPWPKEDRNRDWHAYFNQAFNVAEEPPVMWNETRANWGNYTILVDLDGCGRFDSAGDFYYKVLDLDGDGAPEGEYFHPFPSPSLRSHKLHFNFNGERDMCYLIWKNFSYRNEERYTVGGKYIMNVHGSGFFINSYSRFTDRGWENPIAWYDFDFDGHTDMVMRAADVHPSFQPGEQNYRGDLSEFEVAFELNKNTGPARWHSLDMQLTFHQYDGIGPSYEGYVDRIVKLRGLPEARFLSENMLASRWETVRKHLPYLDGYNFGTESDKWAGVWLIFDEDDDDCRWEEMFGKHELWADYADQIGDRLEIDSDFGGKGKLYVGRFDGRIHLYHAERAFWDVDYLGLYKGSIDRKGTPEAPKPPKGLRYPRVRYHDKDKNGFIDTVEYMTVEYGNEDQTAKIERTISLLDFDVQSDVAELIDPRVDAKITGWKIETWDGKPLTEKDFEGTSAKMAYDKFRGVYLEITNDTWENACKLHRTAKDLGLNRSESLDKDLRTNYTEDELAALKELTVPAGYGRLLDASDLREKYNNGYWLREKVFAAIRQYSELDTPTLEKLYYTGRIDQLCEYLRTACGPHVTAAPATK